MPGALRSLPPKVGMRLNKHNKFPRLVGRAKKKNFASASDWCEAS